MDGQTENHMPLCKLTSDNGVQQADLCKAYIEIMKKMSAIPDDADPCTVAFIFECPVQVATESRTSRPVMVPASSLSIDSFAPLVIRERRKNPPVKRDAERRFNLLNLETGR